MDKRHFLKYLIAPPVMIAADMQAVKERAPTGIPFPIQTPYINGFQDYLGKNLCYLREMVGLLQLAHERGNWFGGQSVAQVLDRGGALRCHLRAVICENYPCNAVMVRAEWG